MGSCGIMCWGIWTPKRAPVITASKSERTSVLTVPGRLAFWRSSLAGESTFMWYHHWLPISSDHELCSAVRRPGIAAICTALHVQEEARKGVMRRDFGSQSVAPWHQLGCAAKTQLLDLPLSDCDFLLSETFRGFRSCQYLVYLRGNAWNLNEFKIISGIHKPTYSHR